MLPSYGWTILTNAIVTRLVNLYSVLRIAKTHNSFVGVPSKRLRIAEKKSPNTEKLLPR